jgi:prolyl-tRNA editing enzyme YbaK/EbsC (Cys-tRNA(Pro) deacylase)
MESIANPAALAALPPAAQRVADLLRCMGHDQPVVLLPETGKTSQEAADALGCQVAEIAKSIVFRQLADDLPVMVVASGADRIDEERVAAIVGPIGKANARFVKEKIGYAIGGVCPIGHVGPSRILVDQGVLAWPLVWVAAGHPHAVFSLTPNQLLAMTMAPVVDVALR